MIVLYIICILLLFTSLITGYICGVNVVLVLAAVLGKKDERERKARCTSSVAFNVVGWIVIVNLWI